LWVDALAPVSAWEGIPIRVDAYTPVGLELANHCRQPKLNICGKKHHGAGTASVGALMGPQKHLYRCSPSAAPLRCLPAWVPTSLPFSYY
jgi:hypothetical protein